MAAPPTLRGETVVLEPLTPDHAAALWEAADDGRIWRFMPQRVQTRADLDHWIELRLRPVREGRAFAFCQRDTATGAAAGTTSLYDIDRTHHRAEIGFTWLGADWWGTGFNQAAKRLLLDHAFGHMGLHRVQFKTDARNLHAQRAIEGLGATREGVLRRHDVMPDGHVRDAVVYSILREESPVHGA